MTDKPQPTQQQGIPNPCEELERLRQERERLIMALGRVDGMIAVLERLCIQQGPPPIPEQKGGG